MKKALAGIITTLFVLGGIGFAQSAVATPIPTAALAGVTGATLSPVVNVPWKTSEVPELL